MSNLVKQARDLSKMFRETADELDEHFHNVKIARVSGNGVAVAGAITTVAGFCLAPLTGGVSLIASVVGTAVAATGGATVGGAEFVGMIIEKTKYSEVNQEWEAFKGNLEEVMKPGLTTEEILDKLRKQGMNVKTAYERAKEIGLMYKALPIGASKAVIKDFIKAETKALAAGMLGLSVIDLITVSIELAEKTKSPEGRLLRRLADDLDDLFKS